MYQLCSGSLSSHGVGSKLRGWEWFVGVHSGSEKLGKKRGELQELNELGKLPKSTIQNIIL